MNAAEEMLKTLASTAPDAPTRCAGWTAHELVAHLAAGAKEMAELVEDRLDGRATRPTRGFEDREAPYRDMADEKLRDELFTQAIRLGGVVAALGEQGQGASVEFSGRALTAAQLDLHGQSEAALHRWDLVGSDAVSRELLLQPEFTLHAVSVLNTMLATAETPTSRAARAGVRTLRAALVSPGQPDVCVVADNGAVSFEVATAHDCPVILRADADSRLLALWGRRPLPGSSLWAGDDEACQALEALLFA